MDVLSRELHRGIIRKFPRRKVYSPDVNSIWGSDLIDYSQIKKYNDGYAYILICVDVFSKFVRAVPLKDKAGKTVLAAFKTFQVLPKRLWTDKGKEYYNREFERYCKENDIILYSTYGESKSVVAERFNRTLKTWIAERMTLRNSYQWVDILDNLVTRYNNRVHSKIGITPVQAQNPQNFTLVHARLYGEDEEEKSPKNVLQIGDRVRVSRIKGTFEKGYDENWSEELFKIQKVNLTKPLTYQIEDMAGEPIEGSFYRQELLKTEVPEDAAYRIDKVIRVDKKKKLAFVKWRGYPDKFNSWVALSELEDL